MPPVSHVKYAFLAAIAASATLSSSVFAQRPKNPPPDDCPNDNPECKCPTDDAVENGCVLISLDLGRTTPWTGSDSVKLKIRTTKASPSLSTPSQLKLVLGYSFMYVGSDLTAAGAPRFVFFAQSAGRTLSFQFADGSSVGIPSPGMYGESKTRLQMVDAEGWATLSNPAYYDLYPGDGSVYRFSASPAAPDFGNLVHRIDPRGVLSTWEDMGVTVLRDAAGNIRQVSTRTRLADVQTLSDTHYTVTVYPLDAEPETDPDTGLLVPPQWNPTRVLDVSQGSSPLELLVGFQKGTGDIRQYRYVEQNGEWTLVKPSGLVDSKEIFYSADETGARRLHLIRSPEGELLRRTEMNFASTPWGWAMTNRIEGIPGDATRTTSWSFYEEGPNHGEIREKITPIGNRILYEYDDKNRVVRESMPLVEKETLYSYAPVDPSDPPLLCDTRPRCVVRKMQGIEIQRTYYVYGTNGVDVVERVGEQGAAYGGTNVLRTVTTYYPVTGSVVDGLVQSVRHEDGTIDNYAYDLADGVWTEFVTHVHEQAPDIVPMRTTRSVRVYNALGRLVDSRTDLCTVGVEDLVPQADWTPIERMQYAYDIDGNEIRREDLAGRLWTAEWAGNCCGKVSETDWQGVTTTYAYDADGRLVSSQEGTILTERLYDDLGRATNVARRGIATADRPAATIHPSSFAYDSLGRLTMREDEDGIRRLYAYAYRPEGGEISTVTEAPGTDCERVTTAISDAAGRTVREFRNGSLRRTIVFEPLNKTIYEGSKELNSPVWREAQLDLFGRIEQTRNPGFGGAVQYSRSVYDSYGRTFERKEGYTPAESSSMAVETSLRRFAFDTSGDLVLSAEDVDRNGLIDLSGPDVVVSNANSYAVSDGSIWSFSESFVFPDAGSNTSVSAGKRETRLSGLGSIIDGTSIGSAFLVSETVEKNILGNATTNRTFVNRTTGRVLQSRNLPTSVVVAETIHESGATISVQSAENVTTTVRNDSLLRPVAMVDMFGNATVTTYDEFGRVAWREDPSSARTLYAYDALGRQVSVTDAFGNKQTTAFDSNDNAVSLRGAQYPVDYSYDEYGRLATMSTYRTENLAHGDATTWLRDEASGLVTNKVYADGNGPTYAYTPDGKPTRTIWARGAWFENVYDAQGRIVQILHDDTTLDATMEYDRLGRLVASSVPVASYRYSLDLLGHATNEVSVIAGATNMILRNYDAFGRQSRLRVADADYDEKFAYDHLGRLSGIDISGVTITYAYTPDSLNAGYSVLSTSNMVLTRALFRDPLRRGLVSSVSNLVNGVDSGSSFDYTYDALGRPAARNLDEFGYNARGEVVWARYGTNTLADIYDYDFIGNFTSNRLRDSWSLFEVNELNEYASIIDGSTHSLVYDVDGNLLTNGVWSYSYDSQNRLCSISSNGLFIAEVCYDARNRRVISTNKTGLSFYIYNGWNVIREGALLGQQTNIVEYFWRLESNERLQNREIPSTLLVMKQSNAFLFPFYDNYGNIVSYFDSIGNVISSYVYDSFGCVYPTQETASIASAFLFSTKLFEYDLYYFGYRFYAPKLGRWINRDPSGEQADINLFTFCNNRTPYSVDYFGLQTQTGDQTKSNCCCVCIDAINVELITDPAGIREINPETGRMFFGHQFYLVVTLSRGTSASESNTNPTLKWEETVKYSIGDSEQTEVISEHPESAQSQGWANRENPCDGSQNSITVKIHDYPTIELPPLYPEERKWYYRQVKFNFLGENSPNCSCSAPTVSKKATQTIRVRADYPTGSFEIEE